MRIVPSLSLLLAALILFGCNPKVTEPTPQAPSPAPMASATPTTTTSHPNPVVVSLGKTSPAAAQLNPRIAEAYSPPTVTLARTATGPPTGFPGAAESKSESPEPGMKWVIVIVDLDAPKGEFSVPLSKIRLIDQSNKSYRLVSFGGSEAGTFTDLREYDRYKMVEPPKMVMRSQVPSKQNFLFVVAAKAEGLSFEF